jgi:hypothetical protein
VRERRSRLNAIGILAPRGMRPSPRNPPAVTGADVASEDDPAGERDCLTLGPQHDLLGTGPHTNGSPAERPHRGESELSRGARSRGCTWTKHERPDLSVRAFGSTSLCKPSSVSRLGHPGRGGDHSSRTTVTRRLERPTRRLERAALIAPAYAALLPMGFAVPPALPRARWALTPPFHPCRRASGDACDGGLFSVALSSAFPPPGVTRHRALWSSDFPPVAPWCPLTGRGPNDTGDRPSGVDPTECALCEANAQPVGVTRRRFLTMIKPLIATIGRFLTAMRPLIGRRTRIGFEGTPSSEGPMARPTPTRPSSDRE